MTNTKLYIATENSDLTEGRGHTVVTGIYTDPDVAVKAVRGRNVMGVGDGDVYEVELVNGSWNGELYENKYYGYTSEGDDPEFDEYLRLKRKFGKL